MCRTEKLTVLALTTVQNCNNKNTTLKRKKRKKSIMIAADAAESVGRFLPRDAMHAQY